MRNGKLVELGGKRGVTLRELRVGDVRKALAAVDQFKALDFFALIKDDANLDKLTGILGDCVELGKGVAWEDLTFSEAEEVWAGFRELNAPFFRALALTGLNIPAPPDTSASSTAAASD